MNIKRSGLLFLFPLFLFAQSGFDITGRVSLRMQNTIYDESSGLNPDSSEYAKTMLIPGWEERMNIAIFARSSAMDITLLGDLANNQWNKLGEYDSFDRLTLSARFGNNEIILGDFFDSVSELFLHSREMRGAKMHLKIGNLWNKASFIQTDLSAGYVQRAIAIGQPLKELYQQYETSGIYSRLLGSAMVKLGQEGLFHIDFNYLYAKDDEQSVETSINEPLTNQNLGSTFSILMFKRRMKMFAEGFMSHKDTLSAQDINDHAYRAGLDYRSSRLHLKAQYQKLGRDYFTAGSPYLLVDKLGFLALASYHIPNAVVLFFNGEHYHNNLNDSDSEPTTTTRYSELGFTTQLSKWPELTVKYRFRDDISNSLMNQEGTEIKTEKSSKTWDTRIAYSWNSNRLSLSGIYVDLDDRSLLAAGSTLGTEQYIANLNFYTRPATGFFISGGVIYSSLNLTNNQKNINLTIYESSRWDIIARKLKMESTLTYMANNAEGGGNDDLLNNFNQLGLELAFEYFFSSGFSLKVIGGTDRRTMDYTMNEARAVISDPDYGSMYFNGYESYTGLRYGAEFNWLF